MVRRNSRPFAFKQFKGEEPSAEDVRKDLEDFHNYVQDSLNDLQFSNIKGDLTATQAASVTADLTESLTDTQTDLTASITRISTLEATVNNNLSGLVSAHARITLEQEVRATQTTALAHQVTSLIATVGGSTAAIIEERTARIDADGTITASLTTEVSARIAGDATLAASVTTEATARITADGFLSGKYTITVTAGNVVTGMNITSSSGSGTNISDVTFQASSFKIYNSSTGVAMFDVSGTTVRLGGTLVVNTAGNKVYIGAGTYNDASTAFYVDSTGQFSLKDKLTWNGATLSINGTVTANAGTIGGFTLSSTTFSTTGMSFTGGSVTNSILTVGNAGAERVTLETISTRTLFGCYNNSNVRTVELRGNDTVSNNGLVTVTDSTGAAFVIQLKGATGAVHCDVLELGSDTTFFRYSSNIIGTNDDLRVNGNITLPAATGRITIGGTTGLLDFGPAGSCTFYNTAATALRLSGSLTVDLALTGSSTLDVAGISTLRNDVRIHTTSKLLFNYNQTTVVYLKEDWGLQYNGDSNHPFYTSAAAIALYNPGSSPGLTAGRIYFSSGVYLHLSGGNLWLNDGAGDRALT